MKSLEIFYHILQDEYSPFVENTESYQNQLSYLKDRYPKFVQHYRICVEKINENDYQVKSQQKSAFAELRMVLSARKGKIINIHELSSTLRILLSDVLRSAYLCITDLRCHECDGSYLLLEVTTSEDYHALSVQEIRFYYSQMMLDEASRNIKKHLHEKVFMLSDEKKARRHIKKYQIAVNFYLDTILNEYLSVQQPNIYDISEAKNLTDIYKLIFQKLEEVQSYLEKAFYAYLDLSLPISYGSKLWLATTNREQVTRLFSHLKRLILPAELVSLLSLPLKNLTKLPTLNFTHYDQQYHVAYVSKLAQLLSQNASPGEREMIHFLKTINCNTLRFFLYVTGKVSDEVDGQDVVGQKLQTLYYYEKCLKESPAEAVHCYNRELPPFREQMSGWLAENICFYKRKFKQERTQLPLIGTPEGKMQKQTLQISVADVALFTRLLYENDLLEGTRKSVLEFISQHYRTCRTAAIAQDSLDRKYYDISQSAKRKIRKLLKSMLTQLDEQIK